MTSVIAPRGPTSFACIACSPVERADQPRGRRACLAIARCCTFAAKPTAGAPFAAGHISGFGRRADGASIPRPRGETMTKALEKTYDGIIIGAGHHGLVLGCYLAKAGLRILLVDRRLQYGGGLTTKEVTAPGFYHNLHSINHFHISETPWFKDLGLEDRVTYITPRYEFGQAHADGTALVFGRDREETIANVARFSQKDAATFREWNRRAEEITARILMPERYAEPLPQAEREALAGEDRDRPRFSGGQPTPAARRGRRTVRGRSRQAVVPVQGLFVRHLAHRHAVEDEPDGIGDPRLRPGNRLSALPGRLVQSGARPDGDLHRRRRHLRAASRDRPHSDRRRPRDRHRALRRPHRAGAPVRRQHRGRASDVRDADRARAAPCAVPGKTRPLSIHRVDAVRSASRAERDPAVFRRVVRSEHRPHAQMEHRRREHGGSRSRPTRTSKPTASRASSSSARGRSA